MDTDITALGAFKDNYIWALRRGDRAIVVDPGDAAPVIAHLDAHRLVLDTILVTHHHADHIGGVAELVARHAPQVVGPRDERIGHLTRVVGEGERVRIDHFDLELEVLEVPGHTRTHIAYFAANMLFCGDTLFVCGCGRLFEGTPAQMSVSLAKLARLPAATRVYCAHEYTLANIAFARAADPDNEALARFEARARGLRAAGMPTVPSTLADELACNPFLRCADPAVARTAAAQAGACASDPIAVLAALREWKNRF